MLRSFQILKQEFPTIHDPRPTIHEQPYENQLESHAEG